MTKKLPTHPGRSIQLSCLEPLGLNVTATAKVLGVTRHTLPRVLDGHTGISAKMAIRLEKAGWSNAERRQAVYDLALARKDAGHVKVKPYAAPVELSLR
ncbi:MAG: HigA family addiction module antitoxin [Vicinamibacterales bacterium]|jgi:addiction module HigA family antidote|nr:HigA family addiction module antitoxin [Vicinamibacterales bacterium]